MSVRKTTAAIATAAAAALVAIVPGQAAQASVAEGYVVGWGNVTDDLNDEGTLSRTSFANSGAVGLWQRTFLYGAGIKEADGTTFDWEDIDCRFGPNTEAATKDWQRKHGLTADGVVGPKTWQKAGSLLYIESTTQGQNLIVNREGNGSLAARSTTNGRYMMHGYASYTSTSFCG